MANRTSSPKVSSITADTKTGILVPNREEIATNKKKEDEYISAVRKWTLLEDAPENMMEYNTRLWLIDKNNDGYPQEVTAYKYDKNGNRFTYVKGHQDIDLGSSKYRTERGTDVLIKIPPDNAPDNASGKGKRKTKKQKTKKRKTKKRKYKKMKKGKKSTFSTFKKGGAKI